MKYISILRGINVSGQKKINMADLKTLYGSLGFENVITYIQSGNVIFNSGKTDQRELKSIIEKAIEVQFGFQVPVILRTNEEFQSIIKSNPFNPVNLETEGTKVLVTFLSELPLDNHIEFLEKYRADSETIDINGTQIYLHCPLGYGKTKLSNNLIEKKLDVEATTRNWKTVVKLYELTK